MCADVVSLRQVRKRRKREDAAKAADENRIRHGRTKAQKTLEETQRLKAEKILEQGRREDAGKEQDSDP